VIQAVSGKRFFLKPSSLGLDFAVPQSFTRADVLPLFEV